MNPTKLLAPVLKIFRRFSYGDRPRPSRDWTILVTTTIILLILAAGWSYLLFNEASTQAAAPMVSGTGGDKGLASLDKVLAIFTKRAEMRTHYLSDYHFVDPSH